MLCSRNLRVRLRGGPPWGFRLRGGKGSGSGLVIWRVNWKGRQDGLQEGDRVVAVNGQLTVDMTLDEVHEHMRKTAAALELQLQRCIALEENNNGGSENGDMLHLNGLENFNNTGSWSTDSTSTGSTTIHIPSLDPCGNHVWSPSTKKRANLHLDLNCNEPAKPSQVPESAAPRQDEGDDEKSPVWQPFGAPYDGPQFRPVKLEVSQKMTITSTALQNGNVENENYKIHSENPKSPAEHMPQEQHDPSPAHNDASSAPSAIFTKSGWSSHLPPSQSPTITLLQKAREGHLPKGAIYIEDKSDITPIPKNAVLIDQKVTVEGDKVHTDSYYAVPTLTTESTTHNIKMPPKYDGIGPTEYGIPVGLRTGVKEEYASDWYKTMFKSLHKNKFPNDSGRTVHLGGYMSEPEYDRKDKLRVKHTSDYRKKTEKSTTATTQSTSPKPVTEAVTRAQPHREVYRVEPGSIANYEPGRSSLAEKEFQKQQEHVGSSSLSRSGLSKRWPNVLLSDGYESDSMLIRKAGKHPDMQPEQQKACYKEIQKGGEIPMTGLRKIVPDKPTAASPHQYQETEVNIHYRSPIRHLEKEYIEEEELKKRQEDTMRRLYEEDKRKKQQQELSEIEMRKHSDFFTPSQKSPIPLNRYDNPFESTNFDISYRLGGWTRGPPPKTMARALYPFTAKTTREINLNKGDILYINKQVDKNWYEGEHHGMVGIFPVAYVEIIPTERANLQPRKAAEGEARVKFNFRAQTARELSLFKGEKVILTRRLDSNWYEGRLGAKKGIFPVSYVEVLQEPGEFSLVNRPISPRPPASPVYSPIISGSPPKHPEAPTFITSLRPQQEKPQDHLERFENRSTITQSLHIDTYNEPIPYRSLYSYKPQNDDELELREGDTVYVMEKCDDGWYVGTSLRTGHFGTFPGNYVERI